MLKELIVPKISAHLRQSGMGAYFGNAPLGGCYPV